MRHWTHLFAGLSNKSRRTNCQQQLVTSANDRAAVETSEVWRSCLVNDLGENVHQESSIGSDIVHNNLRLKNAVYTVTWPTKNSRENP